MLLKTKYNPTLIHECRGVAENEAYFAGVPEEDRYQSLPVVTSVITNPLTEVEESSIGMTDDDHQTNQVGENL